MPGIGRPGHDQPPRHPRASARVLLCVVLAAVLLQGAAPAALAQPPAVVAEQWLNGPNSSGFLSASLDPARRYGLQVLAVTEQGPYRGTYTQNWFVRDGSRRAGSNEGTFNGRTPWEQELPLPALGLTQWTFSTGVWNEGSGVLLVRLLDLGPR